METSCMKVFPRSFLRKSKKMIFWKHTQDMLNSFNKLSNDRGLTLIEVIVGTVISSILLSGLFMTYVNATNIWKQVESKRTMLQEAHFFQQELSEAMMGSQSFIIRNNGAISNLLDLERANGDETRFYSDGQELFKDGYFIISNPRKQEEYDWVDLRPIALMGSYSVDIFGIHVVYLRFDRELSNRLLKYQLLLEDKYEQRYFLEGYLTCGDDV
ncbi:MAG: prepilin-type N-terminal cleavage/methylation domain-containing protein [candidate division Zixibacteria bacterium]|nr:prepilin-type N-terminal cleavage/methylation domain-containing protein [candidate division Zixibacteria bacterium]